MRVRVRVRVRVKTPRKSGASPSSWQIVRQQPCALALNHVKVLACMCCLCVPQRHAVVMYFTERTVMANATYGNAWHGMGERVWGRGHSILSRS